MRKLKIVYLFWRLKMIKYKLYLIDIDSFDSSDLKLADCLKKSFYKKQSNILKKLSELLRA